MGFHLLGWSAPITGPFVKLMNHDEKAHSVWCARISEERIVCDAHMKQGCGVLLISRC